MPVAEAGVGGGKLRADVAKVPTRRRAVAGCVVDGEVLTRAIHRQHCADTVLLIDARQSATEVDGRLQQLPKPRQVLLQHQK